MTNIQAAIGLAQLQKLDGFNGQRIKNADHLNRSLSVPGLVKPFKDDDVKHVYHQYAVRIEEDFPKDRDEFIDYLSKNGVGSAVHYPYPIHLQPLYRSLGYRSDQCEAATRSAQSILSLPVYPGLTADDMNYISNIINKLGE